MIKIFSAFFCLYLVPIVSFYLLSRANWIISFGSGVITSLIFFEILPESFEIKNAHYLIFLGITISLIIDKISSTEEGRGEKLFHKHHPDISFALSIHFISDGFFLGGAVMSSEKFIPFLIIIFFHKIIDGVIMSIIYKSSLQVLIINLFSVLGFILGILQKYIPLHFFLPISCGILIFVSIHDFIPHIGRKDFAFFFLGSMLGFLTLLI